MLLNKTVENQFGPLSDEAPIQKQAVPPLPPIHKESRTEIIRLIHSATPSEVSSYFNKSNVISLLLFSDTSVFDNRLKESLMHSSPDIQVSFFNSTFNQIKKCGEFIDQLIPLLSKFSTDSLLRSQIINTNSNFIDFYRNYYLKLLQSISKLANFSKIKILYTTHDSSSLIYPTENYFHIISYTNSVSGQLFRKRVSILNSPQKNPSFELASEGPVFEDYGNAMSVRFSTSAQNSQASPQAAGAAVVLSDGKFNESDETRLSVVVGYLSPLLKLLRAVFLRAAPADFSRLTRSASSLRKSPDVVPSFTDHLCRLCRAERCRLLLTKDDQIFTEIKSIGEGGESLLMRAAAQGRSASYVNARKNAMFNKGVDDDPQLPKISSMLVTPVRGTAFVAALYNSLAATEFGPVQRAMADSFAAALRPLLAQIRERREACAEGEKRARDGASLARTIEAAPGVIRSCFDGSLFEYLAKLSPDNRFLLFEKISESEALRFPGSDLVEVSDNLSATDFFRETDKFDINIEAANDRDVKRILVTSSPKCTVIVTSHHAEFKPDELHFLKRLSTVLLAAVPFVSVQNSLAQCKASHQLLRDSLRMSCESFSSLISARVELLLFDDPLRSDPDVPGAPLIVSIETARGIEGALVSYDSSSEVKAAVISYAEWLTSALSHKHITTAKNDDKQIDEFTSLFTEMDIQKVFRCSTQKLKEWLRLVMPLRGTPKASVGSLQFVRDCLADESVSARFCESDRLLVVLAAFLRGIHKKWECKADMKTVMRLKKFPRESCALLAAVFASDVGIASGLPDGECEALASRLSLFVRGDTARDAGLLLARARSISMHGFRDGDACTAWLGCCLAELARVHRFSQGGAVACSLREEAGAAVMRSELFAAERVWLPMVNFLSAKHRLLAGISGAVRESIVLARKEVR